MNTVGPTWLRGERRPSRPGASPGLATSKARTLPRKLFSVTCTACSVGLAVYPFKSPLRVEVTRLRMFAVTARDLNRGGLKYNNCLWRVKTLYALASSKEEAVKLVEGGEAGLCGWCMCEAVAEGGGK
ncbi:MAG: hypothetical protein QXH61_03815 [Candidatus Nezhaarchaeales archaeon]